MFVKQIDMKKAFELAARGNEVKVLVPTGPGTGWESMEPDTLQNMLADCLFFRQEPAMENPELDLALRNPPNLMEQIRDLPEAQKNQPPDVWVAVARGRKQNGSINTEKQAG